MTESKLEICVCIVNEHFCLFTSSSLICAESHKIGLECFDFVKILPEKVVSMVVPTLISANPQSPSSTRTITL